MSWRTPTSYMVKETNPRAVFDRLFGGEAAEDRKHLVRRSRQRQSILDLVADDAAALRKGLGPADGRKLDEYLYAVRQIERRIEDAEQSAKQPASTPDYPRPEGAPKDFGEHVKLMMDMIVLAFQADATRIATFMYTNAGSNRSYPNIGVSSGHHTLSHHGNDPKKQAQIAKINQYHVTLLAYFLDRLAGVEEAGGTLLEHSMILYGSGLGDGNRHNHEDLPILLAGHGGGSIRPGRHVRYAKDTPLTNLYLAMLRRMGVKADKFSDSTGELEGLA
jgi:hypothetical protein